MTILVRIRDWWLNQFQNTGLFGKLALLLVPLFFGCCALTMVSALISPAEPTPENPGCSRAGNNGGDARGDDYRGTANGYS
jgi:hypothetical protein